MKTKKKKNLTRLSVIFKRSLLVLHWTAVCRKKKKNYNIKYVDKNYTVL